MPGDFDPSEMIRLLQKASDVVMRAALHALDEAGEQVLGEAQQLCPISPPDPPRKRPRKSGSIGPLTASGTLMSSATSLPAEWDGNRLTKQIGFNTVYAHYQHEGLDFHHTQGEAKYLEKPLKRSKRRTLQNLANAIAEALEQG